MLRQSQEKLLLPPNPLFVAGTLCVALLLNVLPLGAVVWAPDMLLLVLCIWAMHQPNRINVGWAFLLGLLMDVHHGSLLGIHSLAYSTAVYAVILVRLRLQWFTLPWQAVQIAGIFLAAHALLWILRMSSGGHFPGWALLLAPVLETLLWVPASWLLLAPQRRALENDPTRPL